MLKDIRPEDLGEIGQSQFKTLVKSAGWIVNSADDDKAGWDFEIEPPSELAVNYADQSRPVFRVQVKATKTRTAKLRLTYSNLLNLIRYSGPAFVVLFVFDIDVIPSYYYLLHISNDFSGNVLKSLREREISNSKFKINKNTKTVSFDAEMKKVGMVGHEFIGACSSHVKPNFLTYCKNKANWLEKNSKRSVCQTFQPRR